MYVGNSSVHGLCVLTAVALASVCRAEVAKEPEKVLRHAVFFKFNLITRIFGAA